MTSSGKPIIARIFSPFGGSRVALPGIAAFVGVVIAALITSALAAKSQKEFDALTRRREVYSRLATGMRVFVEAPLLSDANEKREFLTAYDQSCVWASEPVIEKLVLFLDVMERFPTDSSPHAMRQKKAAYEACVLAMRRDSGFPNSDFRFRFGLLASENEKTDPAASNGAQVLRVQRRSGFQTSSGAGEKRRTRAGTEGRVDPGLAEIRTPPHGQHA